MTFSMGCGMRSEGEGSFNYRGTQRSDRALCGGFHTDTAIEAALTIRMVFHLPLRQTEGFLRPIHNPVTVRLVTESGVNESNGLRSGGSSAGADHASSLRSATAAGSVI